MQIESGSSPIKENPFGKHPQWINRNSYLIRGTNPPSGVIYDGTLRRTSIKYNWEPVIPEEDQVTVKCKTFEFNGVNPDLEDGAEVAIKPGKLTPVQHVSSETIFSEIPMRGRLIFLCIDPIGAFRSFYFEVTSKENSQRIAQVTQGWIMSWYACLEQPTGEDAIFMEHEVPGFAVSSLQTVPDGTLEFGGTPIPTIFWETRTALMNGQEQEIVTRSLNMANSS